ncbi:hypothetical protein ACFQU2_15265 [Siccirubricoccus deserti]
MSIAERARERVLRCDPAERQEACEHETVRITLANLLTFPGWRRRWRRGG